MPNMNLRLLPHELVFGAMLALVGLRCGLRLGWFSGPTLLFLGMLLTDAALIVWARRRPTVWRWRVRLAFHPVAFNVVFLSLKGVVPQLTAVRYDRVLESLDRTIWGQTPAEFLQAWVHPVWSEILSGAYLLFFPYLFLSLWRYLAGPVGRAQAFCSGFFTIYGLGFLGYTLIPAAGPWLAFPERFSVPLTGPWLTPLNDAVVRAGSNQVDVFPSLHLGVSVFLLGFDWRHHRAGFRILVVPCALLWVSTLYLRYHYSVDLLAGAVLAAVGLWLARRGESAGRAASLEPL
jgi:hypothetical protein